MKYKNYYKACLILFYSLFFLCKTNIAQERKNSECIMVEVVSSSQRAGGRITTTYSDGNQEFVDIDKINVNTQTSRIESRSNKTKEVVLILNNLIKKGYEINNFSIDGYLEIYTLCK